MADCWWSLINQSDTDEASAQDLSEPDVPVVVIDSRTLAGLQRLGAASPVAESRLLFEPEVKAKETINPLLKLAEAKLRSAEILLEQQCTAGVMDLLASSMLALAAAKAGLSQVPAADTAAIWLYNEVLPEQLLTSGTGGGNCASRIVKPESELYPLT